MKKSIRFFVLVLILCLVPLFSAMAQTGTVTVDALNVRASASTDSNVVGVVHQGEKVTIKDSTGNWYKISCNGKSGYVWKKYINLSSSSSSGSSSKGSSSSSSKGTCQPGDTGDAVRKVQNQRQRGRQLRQPDEERRHGVPEEQRAEPDRQGEFQYAGRAEQQQRQEGGQQFLFLVLLKGDLPAGRHGRRGPEGAETADRSGLPQRQRGRRLRQYDQKGTATTAI